MSSGKIIIFSAPSGAGKTTIVRHLLGKDERLTFSVSATTRQPRPNEVDGKDYYFLSVSDFENKIKNEEFAEYEQVYEGLFYGTLKAEIERIWSLGKHVVLDVDVKGGISIKKIYKEKALAIFVMPPSVDCLLERLIGRNTETEESIKMRTEKAEYELSFENEFDVSVINDKLEKACAESENLINTFIGQ
ncbi:guanylate kinase [Sediminitomix flava]|uniref:Guanylate kinase n=1 Tax=Sediminitomix flava TaxID=379075 RepID=A0A315Z041_SEDFL|nr:guanylate kinase [Sediminitomix flava]PWJ36063.1 guanylate kinase [Sediminitomix flava]